MQPGNEQSLRRPAVETNPQVNDSRRGPTRPAEAAAPSGRHAQDGQNTTLPRKQHTNSREKSVPPGRRKPLIEPPSPKFLPQDNAFPIFPTKKEVTKSKARGKPNESAPRSRESSEEHARPSTATASAQKSRQEPVVVNPNEQQSNLPLRGTRPIATENAQQSNKGPSGADGSRLGKTARHPKEERTYNDRPSEYRPHMDSSGHTHNLPANGTSFGDHRSGERSQQREAIHKSGDAHHPYRNGNVRPSTADGPRVGNYQTEDTGVQNYPPSDHLRHVDQLPPNGGQGHQTQQYSEHPVIQSRVAVPGSQARQDPRQYMQDPYSNSSTANHGNLQTQYRSEMSSFEPVRAQGVSQGHTQQPGYEERSHFGSDHPPPNAGLNNMQQSQPFSSPVASRGDGQMQQSFNNHPQYAQDAYAGYHEPPAPPVERQKEAEIEAEMPDFEQAGSAQGGHRRNLTVEAHLSPIEPQTSSAPIQVPIQHVAVPAYSSPVYGAKESSKHQPAPIERNIAAPVMEGFVFGIPGEAPPRRPLPAPPGQSARVQEGRHYDQSPTYQEPRQQNVPYGAEPYQEPAASHWSPPAQHAQQAHILGDGSHEQMVLPQPAPFQEYGQQSEPYAGGLYQQPPPSQRARPEQYVERVPLPGSGSHGRQTAPQNTVYQDYGQNGVPYQSESYEQPGPPRRLQTEQYNPRVPVSEEAGHGQLAWPQNASHQDYGNASAPRDRNVYQRSAHPQNGMQEQYGQQVTAQEDARFQGPHNPRRPHPTDRYDQRQPPGPADPIDPRQATVPADRSDPRRAMQPNGSSNPRHIPRPVDQSGQRSDMRSSDPHNAQYATQRFDQPPHGQNRHPQDRRPTRREPPVHGSNVPGAPGIPPSHALPGKPSYRSGPGLPGVRDPRDLAGRPAHGTGRGMVRSNTMPPESSGRPHHAQPAPRTSLDQQAQPPVPVRPGLTNTTPQPPKPVPVRQYNNNASNGPVPSPAPSQSMNARASVDDGRESLPITHGELDRLRAMTEKNPNDFKTGLLLAKRLVEAASVLASGDGRLDAKSVSNHRERYILDAHKRIKRLVAAGYPDAMFYLADCYGQGMLGLEVDAKEAFTLYLAAAKAGHPAAAYRTAVCCELGPEDGGTRKDDQKAVQWFRRGAELRDVPSMYKLGIVLLKGLLGQPKNISESLAWLKKAAERADADNPHALHQLGLLHEPGTADPAIREKVRADEKYALDHFLQAAHLGYKFSQTRLGQAYEYGTLGLPIDTKNSIAWYSQAASQSEHNAELALSGW